MIKLQLEGKRVLCGSSRSRETINKVKPNEQYHREREHLRRRRMKAEWMGPDRRRGLSTDLPASNPGACRHLHHSTGIHTYAHIHTDAQ